MKKKKLGRPKKNKVTKKKRKPGRPRTNYEFEEAVQKIRNENLKSVREYAKWYALNTPAKLPKRPDRAYKNEWKGWGYVLGSYNDMPGKHRAFRSYEDSKAFARKLNFTSVEQWFEFCRTGKKPDDIPARPDVHYQKKGEWFTWTEFLGTRIHHKIEYAQNSNKYLYIGRYSDVPYPNVYVFGVEDSVYNILHDYDFKVVKLYKLEPDYDWVSVIQKHGKEFFEKGRSNEYIITNPGDLFYDISLDLNEVRNLR